MSRTSPVGHVHLQSRLHNSPHPLPGVGCHLRLKSPEMQPCFYIRSLQGSPPQLTRQRRADDSEEQQLDARRMLPASG